MSSDTSHTIFPTGSFVPEEIPAKLDDVEAMVADARAQGDPVREAEALSWRGGIRAAMGQVPEGIDDLRRAFALFKQAGRLDDMALNRLYLGRLYRMAADRETAERVLQDARVRAKEQGLVWCTVETATELATIFTEQFRWSSAVAVVDEGLAALPALPDSRDDMDASFRLGWSKMVRTAATVLMGAGEPGRAREMFERLEAFFDLVGDELEALAARYAQAPLHEMTGDEVAALEIWTETATRARKSNTKPIEAGSLASLAVYAYKYEDPKGFAMALRARELAEQAGDMVIYGNASATLASFYDRAGDRTSSYKALFGAFDVIVQAADVDTARAILGPFMEHVRRTWGDAELDRVEHAIREELSAT